MSFVLHNAALCWMNLFVVQIVSTASSLFVGGDAAFSNKDKLQQAGQGKIGRTRTSIVRCILLQARTKKAKCPRQRRLTALARSVQKAARTPSDSQADSVDDYTKAKLKQGCSVRKAARTPSDSQADSIDSAGKSNAAMHGDTQHCGQS